MSGRSNPIIVFYVALDPDSGVGRGETTKRWWKMEEYEPKIVEVIIPRGKKHGCIFSNVSREDLVNWLEDVFKFAGSVAIRFEGNFGWIYINLDHLEELKKGKCVMVTATTNPYNGCYNNILEAHSKVKVCPEDVGF